MTLDTFFFQTLLPWLDFLWLPLSFLILRKNQWGKALFLILGCIFTLRMQVELMDVVGQPNGFFNFMTWPVLIRGYVVYGFFILGFLILARWSREKDPYVFIAASITVFMAAFCVSTFVMIL